MRTAQSTPRPVVTSEQMQRRIAEIGHSHELPRSPALTVVSDVRWRLRERVVLLDYFMASALSVSAPEASSGTIGSFIAEDCELVSTRSDVGWRLRLDVRHSTIKRLGLEGLAEVISGKNALKPGALDVSNAMARALLDAPVDLSVLSPDELSGVLRAREWLEVLDLRLPAVSEIRRALDFANVLAPLRSVARDDFVGRMDLLGILGAFVDGEIALGGPGGIRAPEPIAIHGPGGVGKSALVAKFVLRRIINEKKNSPFAYLTFDRTELNPEFPLTLFREAARQLALQVPAVADQAGNLIREFDHQLAVDIALRNEMSASRGYKSVDTMRGIHDLFYLLSLFARLVQSAVGETRIIFLLDTFEIAQRRHASSMRVLEVALTRLRELLPSVRIIVTGRAEARQITSRQVPLGGLGNAESNQFLRGALDGLVLPESLLDEILDRVTGNPLSLRLTAELIRRTGNAILSRDGRRRFLEDLENERIQGVLYRRILDHVHVSVRPLANPGLAVRRITQDLIIKVLAGPCGLGEVSEERAQWLFDKLREEVSLVTEVRPGVLVHRSDVREQMLPLLAADHAIPVNSIHRRAVKYYFQRSGPDEREEELYHRLMLGQASKTLDKRWDELAGRNLEVVLPELPPSSRVYVASRLSLEVSPFDLAAADRDSWVRQVTRQGRRLLDAGNPAAVLAMVQQSPVIDAKLEASVSELWVEALALLGRYGEALHVAEEAVAEADRKGRRDELVQLSIIAGRVAEDGHDFERAYRAFMNAYRVAVNQSTGYSALAAGVSALRVVRRMGAQRGEVEQLRKDLVAAATKLTWRDKSRNPGLLRELAAELGRELPQLLSDAAAYLGVDTFSKSEELLDGGVRYRIDTAALPYLEHAELTEPSFETAEPASQSSAKVGRAVADALEEGEDEDLRESVREYFRSESDESSYGGQS